FGHHGTRHPDLVSAIAVSGDRRSVLVGAAFYTPSNRRPGHLQLRDLESGHEQLAWRAHDNGVCDVAFTADGERALSCGLDGALRLWRLSVPPALLAEWAEGEPYRLLQLPGSPERFAVALLEGGVAEVVVEAERLEVRRRVALPRTTALALLSGGRVLAAHQSAERGHAVVDLATGEVDYLPSPAPHTYRLSASPDGGVVLDAHQHGLRVWDARTLALVRDQPLPHVAFRSLAWDEGGREAFVGSHHGTIGRWDAEALRWTPGWTQVNGGCWVLVGAGGRLLVGATGALRALDPTTGAEVTWPPGAPTLAVTAVAVARGSGTYVALHEDLREGARGDVWEAPSAERPRAVIRTGQQVVRGLSLDRAGRRAISAAAYSKDVLVWDLERPHRASAALQLTDLINYLSAAALSPDGGRVVTGSEDGKVHWWDPDLPTYPRGELPARRGWVSGLAFLDDERVVVASYGPPCLEVWHLTGGTAPVRVPLDEPPWVVACGERASEVFVGGMQGAVERRELPGGARLTRYSAHQRVVVSLDISDRGHLVSVSEDGTVKLSSVLTGDLLGVADLGPTGDRPTSAAFLPGGRVLLVGTARGVVHELEVGSR
ncbi:MAG: WD40 repeat domain-containing protein, partial [Planctomycetota bacterium]|nr:WD40 repeat domain-containing protein [Planctomycetota bacterium]